MRNSPKLFSRRVNILCFNEKIEHKRKLVSCYYCSIPLCKFQQLILMQIQNIHWRFCRKVGFLFQEISTSTIFILSRNFQISAWRIMSWSFQWRDYHCSTKTSISRTCRTPDAIQSCTMRPTTLHESFNSRSIFLIVAHTLKLSIEAT